MCVLCVRRERRWRVWVKREKGLGEMRRTSPDPSIWSRECSSHWWPCGSPVAPLQPLMWLTPMLTWAPVQEPHLVTMHSSPLTIGTRWLPYSIILCPLIELTPIVLTLQGWASIVRPMRPFLALHPSCFLSLFIHFLVYFFLGSRPIVCFLYFYTTPMLACTTLLVFLWF